MPTHRRFLAITFTTVLMAAFVMTRLKKQIIRMSDRFTTRSRKPSLAKLVDLPIEVLVEILGLLEWKEILHVRQTCLRLRDASLARPVWLSLVQWYSATIQPRPFLPEKPLDLHTDRELEHLILRWQSGKAGRSLTQPNERVFSISEKYLRAVHLLQGGRWLLFCTHDGSVKYHDLDSPGGTSEAVTLVPTHFNQDGNTIVLLSVDLDPDVEYMTFNLGIMSCPLDTLDHDPDYPNPPRYARWIEVSRVTSYWDENGRVKGLRAERLACFREEYMCDCDSFTLRGRQVAYSLYSFDLLSSEGDGESIAIVDWTLADSTSLDYPRRLIWRRRARWLELLPNDRLLCNSEYEIWLFDLRDVPITTLVPTQRNQPPRQDALAHLSLFVDAISQPYIVHDSVRFSVLTEEGVKGFIIPHSGTVIDCVDLVPGPTPHSYGCVGYDRAVILRSPEVNLLRYAWPEERSSPLIFEKSTIKTSYWSDVLFDECATRIVFRGSRSGIQAILDIGTA